MTVSDDEKIRLRKKVTKRFNAGVTPHLSKIIKSSEAVRRQFIPSHREAFTNGIEQPFEAEKNNSGIYGLERIYEDRVVITPHFECAAYCRYCFKKTRTLSKAGRSMGDADIGAALDYISKDQKISTVVITGGDPLSNTEKLFETMDRLRRIQHIKSIRIGTRHIIFEPNKITPEVARTISSFSETNIDEPIKSKSISIGLSVNHSGEIDSDVARAIYNLRREGINVLGQTVLLKNVNDEYCVLNHLFSLFNSIGVIPYYLYHCMNVIGADHFRTPVQFGVEFSKEFSRSSASISPQYVFVSQVGKHRLSADSDLSIVEKSGRRYIRRKTCYKTSDYLLYSGNSELPPYHWSDQDGYIWVDYVDGT